MGNSNRKFGFGSTDALDDIAPPRGLSHPIIVPSGIYSDGQSLTLPPPVRNQSRSSDESSPTNIAKSMEIHAKRLSKSTTNLYDNVPIFENLNSRNLSVFYEESEFPNSFQVNSSDSEYVDMEEIRRTIERRNSDSFREVFYNPKDSYLYVEEKMDSTYTIIMLVWVEKNKFEKYSDLGLTKETLGDYLDGYASLDVVVTKLKNYYYVNLPFKRFKKMFKSKSTLALNSPGISGSNNLIKKAYSRLYVKMYDKAINI
ncbi:hypothetical protein [Carp edema virus]|nr:hypothetical protein [Carp edema virus]